MCLTCVPSDGKVGTCTVILSLKKIIYMTSWTKDKVKHMTWFSIFCASVALCYFLFNDCFQGHENESEISWCQPAESGI